MLIQGMCMFVLFSGGRVWVVERCLRRDKGLGIPERPLSTPFLSTKTIPLPLCAGLGLRIIIKPHQLSRYQTVWFCLRESNFRVENPSYFSPLSLSISARPASTPVKCPAPTTTPPEPRAIHMNMVMIMALLDPGYCGLLKRCMEAQRHLLKSPKI